ncbi:hypothetical protein MLD38_039793 [Melastoma candidum]|uniref:Uncharacterized protein n=1 Tax=Melastoma candidum TaxID=119954 RepID=A0ACB9L4E5_9MYRT|nr:hypothetical protein MLD38_039793 [Melastoma candidum]
MEEGKPTWIYPKVVGFSPPERWGHSACYSHGHIYVFGGCRGGLHFGDVHVLDLVSMVWTRLATTGKGPGPRDSHSAVLFGNKMVVFGGTDASRKVNVVHVLDLGTSVWSRPHVRGKFPVPRESHTATLVGERMVVFGGSGDGVGNYLNDVHVLDLKEMSWTSPEVKGENPVPRDSHSAVAVGDRLFVYGGDCGDRYHGDVDVLDVSTMTWSKFATRDPQPLVRAGNGAVAIGKKIYIVGGIGNRHYYNDVWVLDEDRVLWTQLSSLGEQPRGRFSHTAIAIGDNIAIYGGCGEDERPLNELLILKLRQEYACNQSIRRWSRGSCITFTDDGANASNDVLSKAKANNPFGFAFSQGAVPTSSIVDVELDTEEHSLSLSQNSSPPLSDQDQKAPLSKSAKSTGFRHFKWLVLKQEGSTRRMPCSQDINSSKRLKSNARKCPLKFCLGEQQIFGKQGHSGLPPFYSGSGPSQQHMIGSEVRGKVDGAFDSGFLVTASINGKIFRGVLFAPGPCMGSKDSVLVSPQGATDRRDPSAVSRVPPERPHHQFIRAVATPTLGEQEENGSDLQGIVLTLGGPTGGSGQI